MRDRDFLDVSFVALWTQHTAGCPWVSLSPFKRHRPRLVLEFFLFSWDCRNLGSFLITQVDVVWGLHQWLLDDSHQTKPVTRHPLSIFHTPKLSQWCSQEEGHCFCKSKKWCLILIQMSLYLYSSWENVSGPIKWKSAWACWLWEELCGPNFDGHWFVRSLVWLPFALL